MSALSSTKLFVCWAGLALAFGALSCGGQDTDTQTTGKGGSGGSGGSGETGGTGGSGGSGGSTGGSGGSGGSTGGSGGTVSPDGGEIVCNGSICPPTMFGGMSVPACCTAQNACGVSFNGGMCFAAGIPDAGGRGDGAGVPDPSCATLSIGPVMLPGCCMPDNVCGFSSQFGGCMSLDTLRGLGLPGINLPDGGPMSCVFPPPAL